MPSYNTLKTLLDSEIHEFLAGSGIGRYNDEAHMRSNLAAKLRKAGFEVDEEIETTMADGSILIPDIIVHMEKADVLPIELKYNNHSIDEYEEDERKCQRYVDDFGNVKDAYCIFVSNIDHREYGEWYECQGNKQYKYMWKSFYPDAFLFL